MQVKPKEKESQEPTAPGSVANAPGCHWGPIVRTWVGQGIEKVQSEWRWVGPTQKAVQRELLPRAHWLCAKSPSKRRTAAPTDLLGQASEIAQGPAWRLTHSSSWLGIRLFIYLGHLYIVFAFTELVLDHTSPHNLLSSCLGCLQVTKHGLYSSCSLMTVVWSTNQSIQQFLWQAFRLLPTFATVYMYTYPNSFKGIKRY